MKREHRFYLVFRRTRLMLDTSSMLTREVDVFECSNCGLKVDSTEFSEGEFLGDTYCEEPSISVRFKAMPIRGGDLN